MTMDIAMIQDEWWPRPGGGGIHVRELATALANEHGHTVDVFTRAFPSHESTEEYANGAVTVHRRPPATEFHSPLGRFASMFTLVPSLRSSYDVVHGHTILPGVPTKLGGIVGRIPTVMTVHGTSLSPDEGLYASSPLFAVNRLFKHLVLLGFNYDHVITVNEDVIDVLRDHQSDVSYIPNGVDVGRFNRKHPPEDDTILFVGRLTPVKRVSDLIEAFERVLKRRPSAELVVVGSGPQEDALKDQVRDAGIEADVRFEGQVDYEDVPSYYTSASLFVLPSRREGHPLSLLEAWAAELPVVGTDVKGIREYVTDGETGWLVPLEDPEELAAAIVDALENPVEARQVGHNGRQLVESDFTWTGIANRTHRIYEEVVDR